MNFPISLISSLKEKKYTTLLLECIDKKSILFYSELGISKVILDQILKNLEKKSNEREKNMIFYVNIFGCDKIQCFFPKKENLMDDRAGYLRNTEKNTLYIPTMALEDALECYTLSTYVYDVFLSKKNPKNLGLFVNEKNRKILEETIPLLTSIIRARDIINLPPSDTRPEVFVKYIQKYEWKKFTLRVINAAELKKLGCNLLLAVGAGSDYPPYMVILERIIDKKLDTYALIGK